MHYRLIVALAFIITMSCPAYCEVNAPSESVSHYQEVQGLEWMEMSAGERMDYLMAAIYLLNKNGVALGYAPEHYYDALYQKIQRDPSLYTSKITDILASYIYYKESKSRPALDRLISKPVVKQ